MADQPKEVQVSVSPLQKQWLRRAVEVLKGTLVRSRAKEMVESEVYQLRTREIAQLDAILEKLA